MTKFKRLIHRVNHRRNLTDRDYKRLESDLIDFYYSIEDQYQNSKVTGFFKSSLRNYRNQTVRLLYRIFGTRETNSIINS